MRGLPPELILGDARLDAQHAFLFQLLDMAEKPGASLVPSEVSALVKAMLMYCQTHFSYEEKLMRESGFPHTLIHERDHAKLAIECKDLMGRIGNHGSARIPGGLTQAIVAQTLRSWLFAHILNESHGDIAFVKWVRMNRRQV
jgi:hemerythrin-like metal-binding protein